MQTKLRRMFFDIETAANPENVALMADPKPPANLKDPAKIEAAIAEKKAEQIEMAALDPDYGKVLSIGFSLDGETTHTMMNVCLWDAHPQEGKPSCAMDEADMLAYFWKTFTECNGRCVGYNILSFDLPYLMRRSMALGVKVPYQPVLAKFRTEPVTDLMAILYNWGGQSYKGLKQVAKLYRIPIPCPEMDGSQVKDATPDQLREYQASDVMLTIRLFNMMNGVYFNL